MKPAMERIDVGTQELNQLLERAREVLSEEDYRKLMAAVGTLQYLTEPVVDKHTTIRHLRQLLLPASTEKIKDVLAKAGVESPAPGAEKAAAVEEPKETGPRPGHGLNSAEAFSGVA